MFSFCRHIFVQRNVFKQSLLNAHRFSVRHSSSYEADGKTKVKVLNNDLEMGLMINSYSVDGFRLNNNYKVLGPIAIFPRTVLSWNVNSTDDINEKSLRLFCVLEPKIDVLVIGTGDEEVTLDLLKRLSDLMKKYRITVEVLKTQQACTTFNFLNSESRMVAGALLPPKQVKFNDMDYLAEVERRKALYGDNEGQNDIVIVP